MEKRKIPGLATTIIGGIFITFAVLLLVIFFPINIQEVINGINNENAGAEAIGAAIAAIIIGIFLILDYLLIALGSTLTLIFSIINVSKKRAKPIKIINIIYLCLSIITIVMLIIKIAIYGL